MADSRRVKSTKRSTLAGRPKSSAKVRSSGRPEQTRKSAPTKAKFSYEYERPSLTADVLLFGRIDDALCLLLIRRKSAPFEGRWALPGGFVDSNETLEQGARRELVEETGCVVGRLEPLESFGDPGRDPRGWTVSAPFFAVVDPAEVVPRSGDDASDADWIAVSSIESLAFDHASIVDRALKRIGELLDRTPLLSTALGESFTRTEAEAWRRLLAPNDRVRTSLFDRWLERGLVQPATSRSGYKGGRDRSSTERFRFK